MEKTEVRSEPQFESIEEYLPEVHERDWGTEMFIAKTDQYLGKLLRMKSGSKGGLQCHVEKDESFYLLSGRALVEYDPGDGHLITIPMRAGQTFRIPPKAIHRVTAETECVFIETSTPVYDDRYHAEHHYGFPEETGGLPSTWEWVDGEFVRA